MRWRPWFWFSVSMLCFLGAAYFWRLGNQWAAQKAAAHAVPSTNQVQPPAPAARPGPHSKAAGFRLLSQPGGLNPVTSVAFAKSNQVSHLAYRLSNSPQTVGQLSHNDHAIILENALIDTGLGGSVPIPEHLRSHGDPGAYIVQSRGPLDESFRSLIKSASASIVAYIPNNAYLVRATAEVAQQLQASAQSVLPYEPYYKLKSVLLKLAADQQPLPESTALNLLLFPDARETVLSEVMVIYLFLV